MDYPSESLSFKIKKTMRYVSLYGFSCTLVKIKGQYHMRKRYDQLPNPRIECNEKKHVGILGCGNYAFTNIAYYLRRNYGDVIRGVMDIDINHAASLFDEYNGCYYTDKHQDVINDPGIDLIYIASNHATHAEYAIAALQQGKYVHVEKPHVVHREQLVRLCKAIAQSAGKVVSVGFNRPRSRIGMSIQNALESQSGASVINWFVTGHQIDPDHWYFKKEEGGRVLGNLCHWTDFTLGLVPRKNRYPITITPSRSASSDCNIAVTYVFGEGTVAAITFSAKGHTFEGVKERFAAHRGNVLISMDDFQLLTIEMGDKKQVTRLRTRNHGHEGSLINSYELARGRGDFAACTVDYIWETADLFLATKESLEENRVVTVNAYAPEMIS
ncbi:MAG: Gfo/Idh/MocA family oxidoreductase [Pyrinomonadaceae bacterium]|nr:Gfo/Idh/MocA family oxidoreductase [Pyrinomonadaceae bacterium]